jgi:hypothetical protein
MSKNYTVVRVEQDSTETLVGSKAKKADAIALADAERASSRRTTIVRTHTGTEVHRVAGVRPMKSTPRYSRTVELPEGLELPEGARPAYLRKKHDALIVAFDDAEKDERYGIVRLSTGKSLKNRFSKTREAGAFVLTLEAPVKA